MENMSFEFEHDNNETEPPSEIIDVSNLSKRQRKKLIKQKIFLETRKLKRKAERERQKLKRREGGNKGIPSRKLLKSHSMANSNCKIKIVVDCSFDDFMSPKDIGKCSKQINFCYCTNRRAPNPVQFYCCSFDGKIKQEMEKNEGYTNWDVNFEADPYEKIFCSEPKDKLVYLSSESENIIKNIEDDKIYIIGGLVDHNSHKGLCYQKACKQGISHGRLPIDSFLKLKTRKVLTINHVFQILVAVINGSSWKDAFIGIIPNRKQVGAVEINQTDEDCDSKAFDNLEMSQSSESNICSFPSSHSNNVEIIESNSVSKNNLSNNVIEAKRIFLSESTST